MGLTFAPLQEIGPEDANGSFLDKATKVNVVNDPQVRTQLEEVWENIRKCKSRRMELESEWMAIQRMRSNTTKGVGTLGDPRHIYLCMPALERL
jgi:hypothetical protein